MKISNTRKSQKLSLFNDRKSISLMCINLDVLLKMSINLDVLLKNRYM